MSRKFKEAILNQPISELEATPEFKAITNKYGYNTLADILKLEKPYDVLQHAGFDMRMLAEFTHILADHGLKQYLI